jgi:mannose-1-phosphate guanylyltransferase
LPLLGERSLLQGTVERLRVSTDDITVVTDRRYERLVREQVPDAALVLEPLGRNTAAAIALATLASSAPTTTSWWSCRPTRPSRTCRSSSESSRAAAETSRPAHSASRIRW